MTFILTIIAITAYLTKQLIIVSCILTTAGSGLVTFVSHSFHETPSFCIELKKFQCFKEPKRFSSWPQVSLNWLILSRFSCRHFSLSPHQTIHITWPDLTLHENCIFGNNFLFYYSLCAFGPMKISFSVSIDDYFYLTAVMGNMSYILQNEGLYISCKNSLPWRHTTLDNTLITIVQYSQQSSSVTGLRETWGDPSVFTAVG